MDDNTLEWKVNTGGLLKEIMTNNETHCLRAPIAIFASILHDVAVRASQLNDPKLNALMCRLALYDISDPYSSGYDAEKTQQIIEAGKTEK